MPFLKNKQQTGYGVSALMYRRIFENIDVDFVWFDSLRPINNLSVKQGQVFLGWTSTKLG